MIFSKIPKEIHLFVINVLPFTFTHKERNLLYVVIMYD